MEQMQYSIGFLELARYEDRFIFTIEKPYKGLSGLCDKRKGTEQSGEQPVSHLCS